MLRSRVGSEMCIRDCLYKGMIVFPLVSCYCATEPDSTLLVVMILGK